MLEDHPTQEGTGTEPQSKSDDESKEKRWDGRRTTMKGTAQAKEIGVKCNLQELNRFKSPGHESNHRKLEREKFHVNLPY